MVAFTIDTRGLTEEFNLTQSDVENLMEYTVRNVAGEFARKWGDIARKGLHRSRSQYLRSIQTSSDGPFKASVVLVGELANQIESGVGAYDMKPGFQASNKRKTVTRKDGTTGWYLTIPFRFATPGAGGSDVFSNEMPAPVYAVAKTQAATIPMNGGMRSPGLVLKDIPAPYNLPSARPAVSNIPESKSFAEYQHKSSIYEGISKVTDATTGQNRYMSFRRVSDRSDPNAWIHPGIAAHNYGDAALAALDIPTVVDQSIDTFLAGLGFE